MRVGLGVALCTFFGLGLSPHAPGTMGTLGALGCHLLLLTFSLAQLPVLAGIALTTTVIAVPLGYWAQAHFQTKDPQPFVLDEVAGYFLTACFLPASYWAAGLSFVLFRFFDILKPLPVRKVEELPAGWGIVCDDLVAGLLAGGLGLGTLFLFGIIVA